MRLPSVAVSTVITNPISSRYYAFLGFLDSWSKVVDEIVLVDGGTTDNSFTVAKSWMANWGKVRIVNSPATYWHPGYRWHALQAMNNHAIGLHSSSSDWVITINADNVVYGESARRLREQLAENEDVDVVCFYRSKLGRKKVTRRIDTRAVAVNLKRVREKGVRLSFGINTETGNGSDFPITVERKTTFLDPVTRAVKRIDAGKEYTITRRIDLETGVFGHFFFDFETCMAKVRRWDNAYCRFLGEAPSTDAELKLVHNLREVNGYFSKEELLSWEFPGEMKRLIDAFYEAGMVGGGISRGALLPPSALRLWRRVFSFHRRAVASRCLRAKGYRGLRDFHQWAAWNEPDPEPLDVALVYQQQDEILPPWARLEASGPLGSAE